MSEPKDFRTWEQIQAEDLTLCNVENAPKRRPVCSTCGDTGFIAEWSGGSLLGECCPDCPQTADLTHCQHGVKPDEWCPHCAWDKEAK